MSATKRFRRDRGVWIVTYHGERTRGQVTTGPGPEGEAAADALVEREREREARARRLALVGTRAPGWEGEPVTVRELLEDHRDTYVATLGTGTAITQRSVIDRHLVPRLGGLALRDLTRGDLRRFAAETLSAGRSPAIVRNALSCLRRAVNLAVEARILRPRSDERDAEVVDAFAIVGDLVAQAERARPDGEERPVDAWTRAEVVGILALARSHEPAVAGPFLAAVQTGARRGEVLGLRWEDVDRVRGRVHYRRQRTGYGETKRGKWGRAHTAPLPAELEAELEELARGRRVREPWETPGVVFRSPKGRPWDPRNFARAWDRLRERMPEAGIRPLVFHATRHTFASWALEAGRSPKWIAETMGASVEVVLRVYAHWIEGPDDRAEFTRLEAPRLEAVEGGEE